MSNGARLFTSLIGVDADFKPAVYLPDHFNDDAQNAQLIRTYIPTTQSIDFLAEVARSLNPSSDQRARMLHGTFGTGKSDLLLILCNYFSRPVDDPMMQPFYEKLQRHHEAQYTTIYQQRANKKPFLVVLLQANAVLAFPGFILHGLERALKQAGLEALLLPTRYSAARQKLEEWQRQNHPVLQSFITILRENEALELSKLLTELGGAGADSVFAAFQRTFFAAAGTPFDIYNYDRPEETYKRVAQALRERGSHSGILVVCDEFTEVLRRMARSGDQQSAEIEVEALGVQDLANTSMASGQNQLHFVVASLEPFASASADSTSITANKAIEKIGGRFKSFALELQDSAELVRGALRRLDTTTVLPNRQRDELVELARPLWRQPKAWVTEVVIEGCFPLHPLVTYALPLINSRVAQNNRTMFQFLKDNEGLTGFLAAQCLASPYPDWSNLLTLDLLFDYFEKSIQVRYSNVTDTYNHALQLLDRATVETALARRLLKTVAFCEVIAPALSPTRQLLRHALNLPASAESELLAALTLLEQVEALYPPSDLEGEALGSYSLPMAGRVSSINLRQRVLRKARETPVTVGDLYASHPPEAIRAETYNQRRGSFRELKAKYVGLSELNGAARLKGDLATARDGLLWYVIASSESERSEAQSRARELTRQHPRLVVAVPMAPLTVLEAFKNHRALDIVRGDGSLDSSARTYLQDTGRVGKDFYSTLTAAIAKLREEKQWEWFREGASQPNISSRAQAQELASKVMTAVYPYTPEQSLAQQFKAEGITPSLSRAMTELFKGEVRVSKGTSRTEDVIHRTAMTGLGLLKALGSDGAFETYGLIEPSGAQYNSQKIWQLYQSHLSAGKPWHKLIELLREPPFGLYDSLLFAFTGAFFTFHANSIELTLSTGPHPQPVGLDEKLLKALIESPQSYGVRFQPLSPPEEQWLRGVVGVGLKKPFDALGGQGKTLRSRVAAQVRQWLGAQRMPLFAEKLDASQLAALLPASPEPVLAAAILLLRHQADRTDEALAGALLNELPAALMAPADRNGWTDDSVQELLALWGETCRLLERLPSVLEQHAERAVATVFGCEQRAPAQYWTYIYDWRRNRQVVQSQAASLLSNARTLLAQTNKPTGSLREELLDSFAKTIIGINTAYHTWPTLEHLDRLVKELQKARDEIDTRWRALASEEEVWHNGVATAALGRPVAGVQPDRTAQYLYDWATSITWPNCALALQASDLQQLFPTVDAQTCADLSAILRRTQYTAEDWKRELADTLPRQFGVAGWTKAEVEQAVARLSLALKHAANLDALLRKHTLARVLQLFTAAAEVAAPAGEVLRTWYESHLIPAEHDLDENASIVLGQLASSSDAETTLLITLPRALPQIAQSYQQWRSYADLERYEQVVAAAVSVVEQYEPLTSTELRWLTGIVVQGLQRPFANQPRERGRLAQAVAAQITGWLRELQLPPFVTTLTAPDLHDLFPALAPPHVEAMLTLLQAHAQLDNNPASFFLTALPHALGTDAPSTAWSEVTADTLVAECSTVCRQISTLREVTVRRTLAEIGPLFGVATPEGGAPALVATMRAWRQAHVLFAHESLSPDATLLAEALAAPADDPLNLLLTTLPTRLREVRASYGNWQSWEQRSKYAQALEAAATEIAQRGQVSAATPRVQAHWEALKTQIAALSPNEQRWLIKAFNEEFRA